MFLLHQQTVRRVKSTTSNEKSHMWYTHTHTLTTAHRSQHCTGLRLYEIDIDTLLNNNIQFTGYFIIFGKRKTANSRTIQFVSTSGWHWCVYWYRLGGLATHYAHFEFEIHYTQEEREKFVISPIYFRWLCYNGSRKPKFQEKKNF